MRLVFILSSILIINLIGSVCFADWEGHIKVSIPKANPSALSELSGTIHMKQNMVRTDMLGPLPLSVIVDLTAQKAIALMAAPKVAFEAEMKDFQGHIPACGTAEIEKCLSRSGFKKTGKETVNGHPCAIYEGVVSSNGTEKAKIKLWRPIDLKEVPEIKTVITEASGRTIESRITGIRSTAQPDHLFSVPENYRRLGKMKDLINQLNGG